MTPETLALVEEASEWTNGGVWSLIVAKVLIGRLSTALLAETKRADEAEARVAGMVEAISWAMGEGDSDFGKNMPERAGRYWWREELSRRAYGRVHALGRRGLSC